MPWTKASPLVLESRYPINRKTAHKEPSYRKVVSIVATTGEKIQMRPIGKLADSDVAQSKM